MCIIHCKRDNHVLQVVQNKAEIRCSSAIRDQKQIFLTSLFISHIQALFYSLSILHLQWQMLGHCRLLSWRPLTGIDGFNILCAFKVFSVRYLGGSAWNHIYHYIRQPARAKHLWMHQGEGYDIPCRVHVYFICCILKAVANCINCILFYIILHY